MQPRKRHIALTTVLALIVVMYVLLLWKGPWWVDGDHLRQTDLQPADGVVITGFRTTLVAMGAGVGAAIGLYYTHRTLEHNRQKDREQAELTREGQMTDRYVEAIKLLSADNLTQRLGGIYALERIMSDSERDHPTVVEVLTAFIRQPPAYKDAASPREDVQAALTVLGRMPERGEMFRIDLGRALLHEVSLYEANFQGAKMSSSHLEGANLDGANLDGANLSMAKLKDADLVHASLVRAKLEMTHLEAADLNGACLVGAILVKARLDGARLDGADLEGARLDGANLDGTDLRGTTGCTVEALTRAHVTSSTLLPPSVADDPKIREHIRECKNWAAEPETDDDCGWKPGGRSFPREVRLISIE